MPTFAQSFGFFRSSVHSAFERYPRVASGITGFFTFSAGDVLAQELQMTQDREQRAFDWKHAAEIGALGCVSNGVVLTSWFRMLDRLVGTSMQSKRVVLSKVLADQLVYAPVAIATFFGYTSWLSERSLKKTSEEFVAKCNDSFVNTYATDCTIWPIANVINFRLVPLVYRPHFTAFMQLLWQIYMSYVSAARHVTDDVDEEVVESAPKRNNVTWPVASSN